MAIVKSWHYHRGCKGLVKGGDFLKRLDQVTEPGRHDDFGFAIKDLKRDRILWVVLVQTVSHKTHNRVEKKERYALFREKSFDG